MANGGLPYPIPEANLVNLHLRKNIKRQGNDKYFWGGIEPETGENIPTIVNNIINLNKRNKNDDGVIKNVANSLDILANKAIQREMEFIHALEDQKGEKKETIQQPSLINSSLKDWKNYVSKFHNYINQLLGIPEDVKKLINMLRSKEFLTIIGGQSSAFSSTRIKNANQTHEQFFKEMGNLLLTKNKKTFSAKQYNNKEEIEKNLIAFIKNHNFQDSFKDGIQEQWESIYKNPEALQIFLDSVNQIIRNEFPTTTQWRKSAREKGISENLERRLKRTTMEIFRQFFPDAQDKMINITPDDEQNPYNITLRLRPKLNDQNGTYTLDVSMKINDLSKQNDTNKTKNEIFDIFYNFIEEKLPSQELKNTWVNKKSIIREAVLKDFNKRNKFRSAQSISNILEGYGESGIKGVLGEIVAALQFSYMGNKVSITGSDITKAGQLSFDVVIKTLKGQFGIQVKNFNNFRLKDFYRTEFDFSNEDEMNKYFGEESKKRYWFLLANGELITDIKLLSKTGFQNKILDSFYNYTDNFLRIQTMDIAENFQNSTGIDITSSDVFLIGSYIVPSSFLLFLIYKKIKDNRDNEKYSLFSLSNINKLIQPIKLQESGSGGVPINKNLFENYRLTFNGLTADITLNNITF